MPPLDHLPGVVPGRLTYVNDAQDRRLPFGSRIRIDGDAEHDPYQPEARLPRYGLPSAWPAQATYDAALALLVAYRDEPPDGDAVRDLVVVRTARGECCACGRATARRRSFVHLYDRPERVAVTGPCEIAVEAQHYPCCDRPGCSAWLDAQELLGRLPHQSTTAPRARWAEEGPGWTLETRDQWLAYVVPYGLAWGVISGPRRDPPVGRVLGLGDAMRVAEQDAVGVGPGLALHAEELSQRLRGLEAFLEQDALRGRGPFTAQYDGAPGPRPERTWPARRRGRG